MFKNKLHSQRYLELLKRWQTDTVSPELMALFFLIAGSDSLYQQADAIIDFDNQRLKITLSNEIFSATDSGADLLTLTLTLFDNTVDHGKDDPVTLLGNLSEEDYELAVNALHVRFNKMEFVTYQYDPVEDFN
ncbi:DUF6075 family protein [Candidatus Enterococcus leclercqii]|uniref:DUF6075 family protein n=1 Tax=Candidatus Enterococcus leclercqii TaxID=1857218 RepID=UPI00137978E3|nr:DUF6075 family protein [Enterococcus sp. CU9D]KAF1293577.1 hypothetical protein BAU14_02380 [Enterococcus sp. CU9D]